ncbi:unnamed protein product, partial [Mesorhabditis belari]|uniref:pyridoxal 5'-phosphate synthase n=1 Tax=Mesorhabditis belari TaxID=2138241 RepID=A0AAF3E933_9BILA
MADTPLDITTWRRHYHNEDEPVLIEDQLPTNDPYILFDIWFKNISSKADLLFEETNAVCVSTVSEEGQPSSRMVLMRSYTRDGFVFHTNYDSRKGQEIAKNNRVALLFFWPKVHRQVRVEGRAEYWTEAENDAYWNSRPLPNRIGTKCSEQSKVIENRQILLDRRATLEKLAAEEGPNTITRPKNWGGFLVRPNMYEFWQGQSDRVHDRLIFTKDSTDAKPADNGWFLKRLSP